jgi:hypothetical protein
MTQRTRNTLVFTWMIVACICGVLCLVSASGVLVLELKKASLLDIVRESRGGIIYIPGILILTIASIAMGIVFQFYFRKNPSYELFLFTLAILALSFEGLRGVSLFITAAGRSDYYLMLIARAIFFSRFFGAFCLFCSGLMAAGIQFQRIEVMLGACLALSLALATILPVDSSVLENAVTYRGSKMNDIVPATIAFEAFAVMNYLLGGYAGTRKEYLSLAAAVFFVAAGKELLFYAPGLVYTAAGCAGLGAGLILYLRRVHDVYQWV